MRALVVASLLVATTARADGPHLFYVEALGKGGLYGVGYEYAITDRLGLGAAASFSQISDQQVLTLAPYLHARILGEHRHALFCELGAILAHSRIPSPVMSWDGMSDTGGGGFATLGWQYTWGHLVVRASGGIAVGEGGIGPMLGVAIGARP